MGHAKLRQLKLATLFVTLKESCAVHMKRSFILCHDGDVDETLTKRIQRRPLGGVRPICC